MNDRKKIKEICIYIYYITLQLSLPCNWVSHSNVCDKLIHTVIAFCDYGVSAYIIKLIK